MKIIETTIYKCDYCKKIQYRKCDMTKHEKWCKHNPANAHRCFQHCIHLVKSEEEYDGSTFDNENYTGKRTLFHCELTLQKMYSFIAERRQLPVLKEQDVVRMPLECDKYKDNYYDINISEYLPWK